MNFGCKILVNDPIHYSDFFDEYGVRVVPLDTLLCEADVITLHTPLTAQTMHLLNAKNMFQIKSSAIIINAARGGLVDEVALKSMLLNNQLAGAAFDVFENEPIVDIELVSLPNFIATPHVGGSTIEAVLEMGDAAIEASDASCTAADGTAVEAANAQACTDAGADNVWVDEIAAVEASAASCVDADGADAAAGTLNVTEVSDNTNTAIGANSAVVVLVGATFAAVTDVKAALETGGSRDVTVSDVATDVDDAMFVVYSDGTDAYVAAFIAVAETAANDGIYTGNDLQVVNLIKLSGITSIASGDFTSAMFDFQA